MPPRKAPQYTGGWRENKKVLAKPWWRCPKPSTNLPHCYVPISGKVTVIFESGALQDARYQRREWTGAAAFTTKLNLIAAPLCLGKEWLVTVDWPRP